MKFLQGKSISLDQAIAFFWGLVLLCIPITTFNFFPSFFPSSQTRPLALYPLAILLLLLLYRQIKERDFRLPSILIPLLAFLTTAFVSTVLGFGYSPVDVRGQSYLMISIKGWLSTAIGLSFFYAAFMSVRNKLDLERSMRWMFAGFLIGAVAGIAQTIAIQSDLLKLGEVHSFLSNFLRQTQHGKRVSGLAFEPSWYADQLIILYLPWLISASLFDLKLTGRKIVDWALFLLLGVLLLFTYSRSGILNAGMSIALTSILTLPLWWKHFVARSKTFFFSGSTGAIWVKRIGFLIIMLVVLVGFVFTLTRNDYFINIFDISEQESMFDYLIDISFGPRAGYAIAAYEVFEEHPVFGVGWGASGLHLFDHFPDWLKTFSRELEHFFDPAYTRIPNPKNMYARLLAETGLVGFWLFIGFQLSVLGQVVRIFSQKESMYKGIGYAGLLIWLLVSIRYLTMDSFASPVPWIGLGIITGIAHHLKK